MPAFLLPVLGRLIPVLGMMLLAWFAWHKVDNWCNSACQAQSQQLAEANSALQQAHERATALALLWSEAINKVEVRYVEVARDRAVAVQGLRERAGRIRPSTDPVRVRVPADALGVLGDAARLANSPEPAAAAGSDQVAAAPVPGPAGPADTTLSEWISFAVDAAEAYREASDKHQACVAAYEAARSAVGTINSGD